MGRHAHASLAVCSECDWVMTLPRLHAGETACCPRCGHAACRPAHARAQGQLAWASAALIMLAVALPLAFVSFEVQGVGHMIVVADTAWALFNDELPFLGLLVLMTTIGLPLVYLLVALYLNAALALGRRPLGARGLARLLTATEPWVMGDVFVVGVLVSMIKVLSLADVQLGPAFPAFCAYAVLLLATLSTTEPQALWAAVGGAVEPPAGLAAGGAAVPQGAAACPRCGAIVALSGHAACPRCGHRRVAPDPRRLQITWALIVTAGILYIPAMTYPVMVITEFGRSSPQTIVGGARYLAQTGSWPIALIVFAASVVVPIGKVLALGWLCLRARTGRARGAYERLQLYRITEKVGRWSMIDVFVVALLVALIQAGELMRVQPGPGAVAFAAVVILTMAAALAFDPRLIWRVREGSAS